MLGWDRHAGTPGVRLTHVDGFQRLPLPSMTLLFISFSVLMDELSFYFIGLYRLIRF